MDSVSTCNCQLAATMDDETDVQDVSHGDKPGAPEVCEQENHTHEAKDSTESANVKNLDGIGPHEHKWKPYYIIHIGSGKKKGDIGRECSGIFECTKCPFIAPTAKDVSSHKAKEHREKPRVVCEECGKDFARKYELHAHVRTIHLGIRDAHCPHCDYVASEKGRIKKHIQTVHLNIRSYKCIYCKYAAKNKSGLDNHINAIHLKLKKHQCPYCDYSAVQSGQIQTHVNMKHSKTKPHKCDMCPYRASDKSLLRRHVKQKHLKVKSHICSECGYGSVSKTQLDAHYHKKHSDAGRKKSGPKVFNVQKLLARRAAAVRQHH